MSAAVPTEKTAFRMFLNPGCVAEYKKRHDEIWPELSALLTEAGVRVRYLHSDVDTLRRVELLRELRQGIYDVLVGINLLRDPCDGASGRHIAEVFVTYAAYTASTDTTNVAAVGAGGAAGRQRLGRRLGRRIHQRL